MKNLQVMYWDTQNHVVRSQCPDTVMAVMRDGINIYPLLSYDLQIANAFRQNATIQVVESAVITPTLKDLFITGPYGTENLPALAFDEFIQYLNKLRQLRWNCIRRLDLEPNQQQRLLKGQYDTLSDDDLFFFAKRIFTERRNLEYPNLRLTRESKFISLREVPARTMPKTRVDLSVNNRERDFIYACQPHPTCLPKPNPPFWGDCLDFSEMNECITYRMAALDAKENWKATRQSLKDLQIQLPVSIPFLEWKRTMEATKKNSLRANYEECLSTMSLLTLKCHIGDAELAGKINDEERRLLTVMKTSLNDLWLLQKEKKTVADGDIFDPKMLNSRCLPKMHKLLGEPNINQTVEVTTISSDETDDSLSDWSGEWSD